MSTAMTTVSPRGQRRRRSQLTIDELYNERQILRKEWMKFLDSMDSSDETSYEGNSTLPGCNVSEEITTDTAASTTAASTAAASTTSTITTAMSNKEILQVQSHLDYDYDCDNNDNDNDNNDPAYRFIKEQVDQLDEISKEFSDLPNMNMNLNMNMNNNNTPSPTGTSNDAFEQEWKALDKLESDLYKELTECDINVAANNIKSYVTSKDDDDGSYFVEGNNNNNNNNNNTESEMNDEYRGEQHHQQQQQQIQQQQQQQQKTTTILNNDGDSTTVSIIMMEKENNDDSIRDDIVVCVNDCNGEQQQQQQLEYECVSNDLLLYATKIMTTTKNKTIEEKESESPDNIGISHSRSSSSSSSSSSSTTASNTATALNHNDLLLHAAKIMTTKKNKTIEELESESPDNSGSSHSRSSSSSLLSSSATSNTATALKHMRRRRRSRSRSSISNSNEQPVVVTVTTTNNNSGSTISTTELLFTTKEKARNHNTSNDDGEGEGTIVLVEDNYSCIVNTNNDDDIDNGENTIIRHDDPGSSEEDSSEEEEEEEEEEEKQQQQQIEQVEKKNITTTTPSDHDGDDSIQKFQCGKLSCFQNSNENPVPRTSVLAINVDEDDNDEKQHLKVINLIEYRIDINDSDIIGTGMMDANIDQQQQQQQLCCAEMCSSAADSDVLDYVFENVESYTCGAADASVPRLGVVSPTGNKQLLLPDNTNNMLALNRDSSLVEGGPNGQPVQLLTTTREGDLLDYCFEHVESYICTSTSFDEDVYRNRYSKSVLPSPKKSSKPSAALQSKSLQQLQKEWYISLSSNNSMYKQDLSTISEISSRKEQPSPYNKIAGADVEAIESWRNSSSKKEEDECAVHKNPPLPLPLPSSNTNASTGTTTSTITQAEDCQEEEEEEEEEEGYELKVDGIKSSDYNNEPSLSPSVEKVDEEIVVEAVYDNVITAHDEENDDDVNDLLNNIATNTSSDEEVEDLHQQPQQHQQQVQIQIQIQIQNEHQPISPLLCERIVPPVLADIAHQESSSIHCRSNSNNSNNSTNNNQCSNITPAPAPATSPDKSTTTNNSNAQKSHTIRVTPFSSFNKPSPSETKLNELNNEQQFLDDRNDFSTVVVTKISSITVEEEDNGMIVSSPGFGRDGCDIDAAALLNQILLEVDKDIEVIELPHKKMSVTDGTVYKWQDQNNDNGDYAVSSNNSFTTIPTVAIEEEEKQSINELPPPSAAAVPSFLSPNLTFELDAASNESSDLMWSKWSVNEYPSDEPPQKQESMEHDGVASCLELEVMNTTVCGTASDGEVSPLTTPIHHVEEQQEQEQEANTAPTPTSYTFFSNIPAVKKSIEGDDEDDEDGQEQNDDNIDVVPIHDDDHDDNEYCDTTNNNNNNIIIHTNKSNESQDSSSSISQVLGRVYARIIKGNNNKNSSGSSIIKSIINNKGNDTNNDNSIVNEQQQQRQEDDNSTIVENIPTQEVVATTTTNDNGRFTSDNDNDANGIEVIYDEKEDDSSNGTVGVDCNDGSNDGDASTTKTTATTRSLSPASVAEIMELRSDDDEISSLVRHSNQKVLDSIVNQDYDTYSKITSDDITGIDCYDIHNSNDNSIAPTTATATATTSIMASTMIVEGRSACWNKMIASINNKHNRPTTIKFITTTRPTVRKISSDVIVLVYSRYDHHNFDNENSEKQQHQQQGISSKNSATTSTSTSSNSFITTSNETRIWKKIMIKQNEEEKWVNCHFHRSLAS